MANKNKNDETKWSDSNILNTLPQFWFSLIILILKIEITKNWDKKLDLTLFDIILTIILRRRFQHVSHKCDFLSPLLIITAQHLFDFDVIL